MTLFTSMLQWYQDFTILSSNINCLQMIMQHPLKISFFIIFSFLSVYAILYDLISSCVLSISASLQHPYSKLGISSSFHFSQISFLSLFCSCVRLMHFYSFSIVLIFFCLYILSNSLLLFDVNHLWFYVSYFSLYNF